MTAAVSLRSLSGGATTELLSFDRASARRFDLDGHLHVVDCNISKATVNPYYGREIPGYQTLGLDANKKYMMLRHPDALREAAQTFDGKPLLLHHKPVAAHDHAFDLTIGAVSDVRYEHPYLKASLHVWPGKAIDAIQTDRQKELSCGYKYTTDMTPGTYEGKAYDGVMRAIVGNHVAIVDQGRAGPDVYVADGKPSLNLEKFVMPTALSRKAAVVQGALAVTLGPRLTQDASVDLVPILSEITAQNYTEKKDAIAAALTVACDGKLAANQSLEDIPTILDALDKVLPADADPDEDEETPEERRKRLAALAAAKGEKGGATDAMITQDQLDAAMKAAESGIAKKAIEMARKITEAQAFVRPWVGDIAVTCDSAEEVYKAALNARGVKLEPDVPPAAYKHILEAQPKTSEIAKRSNAAPAMDAASSKSFSERFPGADKIRVSF